MSTFRPWAVWRRIQYGLGFFSFWTLMGVFIYYANFYQPPSCFDLTMNGDETGIDCGGGCVRICASDVIPPQLVWTKSFEITKGQYNAVAYVENKNFKASTPELRYTFQLFNNDKLLTERSGTTILPPNDVYPIFEGRIFTDPEEVVTNTKIILEPANMWLPAEVGRDQFRSLEKVLTRIDTNPRLDAKIENTSVFEAENIEVVATLFSDGDEPVTASQTFVEDIPPRSTKDIVFTWPNSIAKVVRSCEIPTDVVLGIDLSGSMNNDGGIPPQPVTAALEAAGQFVGTLRTKDAVAVTTFATQAILTDPLSNNLNAVAEKVVALKIAPEEEQGFTNTVEALKVASAELNSERHNPDARRVLILLTDGLPTTKGDADVVAEAVAVAKSTQEQGIEIYTIGLGESVDKDFVRSVASDVTKAYFAPSGADLSRIYKEITSSLCEVGPTKIDVYAKTKTNFAPLE